jgi:hypothetical protein
MMISLQVLVGRLAALGRAGFEKHGRLHDPQVMDSRLTQLFIVTWSFCRRRWSRWCGYC